MWLKVFPIFGQFFRNEINNCTKNKNKLSFKTNKNKQKIFSRKDK